MTRYIESFEGNGLKLEENQANGLTQDTGPLVTELKLDLLSRKMYTNVSVFSFFTLLRLPSSRPNCCIL